MPTNADVLNFATQKLIPKWTEQFYQYHPVLEKILLKGNVERSKQGGPYIEFPIVTNGPGAVTRIETGSEVYSSTRRTIGQRGRVYAPRMVYSFIIPGKDLSEAAGETAIARLIKVYPEAALMEFHEYIVGQFVNGNGSANNVQGFATLNGDTTYDTGSGLTESGVMDFAAYGSQTGTVFNIDKTASTATDWQNQYQTCTSFATNGRSQMRRVYWDASMQGKQGGPVDVMLGDIVSFNNYYDDLDDQVRYQVKHDGEKGKAVRQGLMFQEAEFYVEPELNTSLSTFTTTSVAGNGLVYMLKSDTWHLYTMGEDTGMETKGDFAFRGPVKVPGQDAWEWEIVLSMQAYCDRLNANGVVAGTAIS
tara:strand:+ start:1149 stop:2237 length:1089 start_codon:yes stop_codon:yes gene_type:complete